MKAEVYAAHSQLSVDGAEITADSVKCKFLGKEEKAHTIIDAIKIHNEKLKTLVDKLNVLTRIPDHHANKLDQLLPQNWNNSVQTGD